MNHVSEFWLIICQKIVSTSYWYSYIRGLYYIYFLLLFVVALHYDHRQQVEERYGVLVTAMMEADLEDDDED